MFQTCSNDMLKAVTRRRTGHNSAIRKIDFTRATLLKGCNINSEGYRRSEFLCLTDENAPMPTAGAGAAAKSRAESVSSIMGSLLKVGSNKCVTL